LVGITDGAAWPSRHCTVVESVPQLNEELRVLLFQAVRELLFNIVKDAGVATAMVALAVVRWKE